MLPWAYWINTWFNYLANLHPYSSHQQIKCRNGTRLSRKANLFREEIHFHHTFDTILQQTGRNYIHGSIPVSQCGGSRWVVAPVDFKSIIRGLSFCTSASSLSCCSRLLLLFFLGLQSWPLCHNCPSGGSSPSPTTTLPAGSPSLMHTHGCKHTGASGGTHTQIHTGLP